MTTKFNNFNHFDVEFNYFIIFSCCIHLPRNFGFKYNGRNRHSVKLSLNSITYGTINRQMPHFPGTFKDFTLCLKSPNSETYGVFCVRQDTIEKDIL